VPGFHQLIFKKFVLFLDVNNSFYKYFEKLAKISSASVCDAATRFNLIIKKT
jgi:hypothetical protein